MDWVLIVVVGVLFVAMIAMQFVSAKKSKKKQEEMQNKMVVGTEIMTVGGIVGKIVAIDPQKGTVTISTGESGMEITFVKQALRDIRSEAVVNTIPAKKEEIPQEESKEENADEQK